MDGRLWSGLGLGWRPTGGPECPERTAISRGASEGLGGWIGVGQVLRGGLLVEQTHALLRVQTTCHVVSCGISLLFPDCLEICSYFRFFQVFRDWSRATIDLQPL